MNYISTEQAAKMLKVSARHLRTMIRTKELHADRVGHSWLLDRRDVEICAEKRAAMPKDRMGRTNPRSLVGYGGTLTKREDS